MVTNFWSIKIREGAGNVWAQPKTHHFTLDTRELLMLLYIRVGSERKSKKESNHLPTSSQKTP